MRASPSREYGALCATLAMIKLVRMRSPAEQGSGFESLSSASWQSLRYLLGTGPKAPVAGVVHALGLVRDQPGEQAHRDMTAGQDYRQARIGGPEFRLNRMSDPAPVSPTSCGYFHPGAPVD